MSEKATKTHTHLFGGQFLLRFLGLLLALFNQLAALKARRVLGVERTANQRKEALATGGLRSGLCYQDRTGWRGNREEWNTLVRATQTTSHPPKQRCVVSRHTEQP